MTKPNHTLANLTNQTKLEEAILTNKSPNNKTIKQNNYNCYYQSNKTYIYELQKHTKTPLHSIQSTLSKYTIQYSCAEFFIYYLVYIGSVLIDSISEYAFVAQKYEAFITLILTIIIVYINIVYY